MSVRNLDKIFKPYRIALLGTTDEPDSVGLCVLRNLINGGFQGVIYPVSPDRESIQGISTYPSLQSLPRIPDLAILCARADAVPALVQQCGEAGVLGVSILSGGFREAGPAGRALEQQVAEIAERFDGMRVLGPNSLGFLAPGRGLNASHSVAMPKAGRVAFISESRALCNSVMDWATEEGIGFSYFVSIGNMLDVGFGDLIDYFGSDPETRAIILYVQSLQDARRFMSAARAFARAKPIVAYKAGRFAESAQVAASHTGAMVAEDAVYEAAFERAGVVRVTELDDVFDVAEVLASQRLPRGARLAIVSNAGGPAIIAVDSLLSRGGQLAQLAEATLARLDAVLPPSWPRANPVDLLDGAPASRFAAALPLVLEDESVDAVLVIFAVQSGSDALGSARAVADAAKRSSKPVLAAWMGGGAVREGIRLLNAFGLPTHTSPEQAVRAFMHLVSYARNVDTLYETPRDMPVHFSSNRHTLRKRLRPLLARRPGSLTENEAKTFLRAYDIPVFDSTVARTLEEALEAAGHIGYPVVLKILSPHIVHKTDVGGVALDLKGPPELRAAHERMLRIARTELPDAEIRGVTVQKMLNLQNGIELILGAKKDPTFGAVIMAGLGGIATGVFRDRALGLPPLNERLARRMLESLRAWPLLQGFRGRPPMNLDRLIEVMIRFSYLVADYPEIQELDINPLLVTPEEVLVLDAVLIPDCAPGVKALAPYGHLAIRPYPEECVRHARLEDDTRVTLRPIRPEDEPLWHALIAMSSPESIRFRFRTLFKQATHRMAVQHCVIDYEREIAIVAETTDKSVRKLIGVAQLLADATHETAEYAVLVPDPWQGKGLGRMLLDHSLELARRWGIKRIVAETDPQNSRMLNAFARRGFQADVHREEEVVFLQKWLVPPPVPATTGGKAHTA